MYKISVLYHTSLSPSIVRMTTGAMRPSVQEGSNDVDRPLCVIVDHTALPSPRILHPTTPTIRLYPGVGTHILKHDREILR